VKHASDHIRVNHWSGAGLCPVVWIALNHEQRLAICDSAILQFIGCQCDLAWPASSPSQAGHNAGATPHK
jgi:hypothetical protein